LETTKILEIRLVDISSLLVKDFVRATDLADRAVAMYTLVGNVRRSTVKIRKHMWAHTTVTIFALNKINVIWMYTCISKQFSFFSPSHKRGGSYGSFCAFNEFLF